MYLYSYIVFIFEMVQVFNFCCNLTLILFQKVKNTAFVKEDFTKIGGIPGPYLRVVLKGGEARPSPILLAMLAKACYEPGGKHSLLHLLHHTSISVKNHILANFSVSTYLQYLIKNQHA